MGEKDRFLRTNLDALSTPPGAEHGQPGGSDVQLAECLIQMGPWSVFRDLCQCLNGLFLEQ